MTTVRVKQLFAYPVKGLTPQVENRIYPKLGMAYLAIALVLMYDSAASDNASLVVPWMKQNFAMQCDWPGLAGLDCHYEPSTGVLTARVSSYWLPRPIPQLLRNWCVLQVI